MKIVITFILILGTLASCSKEKRSVKAGEKMRNFIIELSQYAKGQNPNFIVIPQNGIELCFKNEDASDGLSTEYFAAIDGIGMEELYFNGESIPDDGRIAMTKTVAPSKPILVSDFANSALIETNSYAQNDAAGFLAFPRAANGYDYQYIPSAVHNENTNNIVTLSDAQNYLYLISTVTYSSKTDYLNAIAATNFDVVLIDLFYNDVALSAAEVNSLKTKANGGSRLIIAYMNIGAAESYRYYWQEGWKLHKPRWLKKPYEGYEDEIWVKYWNKNWKEIIYGNANSYTQKIVDSNFDGVYLDNIEAYYFLYFD